MDVCRPWGACDGNSWSHKRSNLFDHLNVQHLIILLFYSLQNFGQISLFFFHFITDILFAVHSWSVSGKAISSHKNLLQKGHYCHVSKYYSILHHQHILIVMICYSDSVSIVIPLAFHFAFLRTMISVKVLITLVFTKILWWSNHLSVLVHNKILQLLQ